MRTPLLRRSPALSARWVDRGIRLHEMRQIWNAFLGDWVSAVFASVVSPATGGWARLANAGLPVAVAITLLIFSVFRGAAVLARVPLAVPALSARENTARPVPVDRPVPPELAEAGSAT